MVQIQVSTYQAVSVLAAAQPCLRTPAEPSSHLQCPPPLGPLFGIRCGEFALRSITITHCGTQGRVKAAIPRWAPRPAVSFLPCWTLCREDPAADAALWSGTRSGDTETGRLEPRLLTDGVPAVPGDRPAPVDISPRAGPMFLGTCRRGVGEGER